MSKNRQFTVSKPGSMNTQNYIPLFMNIRFQFTNMFLPVIILSQPAILKHVI